MKPPRPAPGQKLYRVNLYTYVEADVFVAARDPREARRIAERIDLDDIGDGSLEVSQPHEMEPQDFDRFDQNEEVYGSYAGTAGDFMSFTKAQRAAFEIVEQPTLFPVEKLVRLAEPCETCDADKPVGQPCPLCAEEARGERATS